MGEWAGAITLCSGCSKPAGHGASCLACGCTTVIVYIPLVQAEFRLAKAEKNAKARAKRAYDRGVKAGEHAYYFKHHKVGDDG